MELVGMGWIATVVVAAAVAVVATLVLETLIVGVGARSADLPAPVGQVVAAVLLGDLLAFVAAGVALVPGCCVTAVLGGWAGWVASALLMWLGRAVGYRLVLGGRMGPALSISGVVTGLGVVFGGVVVLVVRLVLGA